MIREIELGNVRIFEGEDWRFELRPLTVFCGANSAGKSTLLKTLLVLNQSQNQKFASRLCLAGPRVDFGDYRAFVSHHDVSKKVFMAAKVDFMVSSSTVEFIRPRRRVAGQPKSSGDDVAKMGELKAAFTFSVAAPSSRAVTQRGTQSTVAVSRSDNPSGVHASVESALFQVFLEQEELLKWKVIRSDQENTQGQYKILLPTSYFKRVGGFNVMSVVQDGEWVRVITTLDGLLPRSIVAQPKPPRSSKTDDLHQEGAADELIGWALPPFVHQALLAFNEVLEKVHYLGPLRAPAKRYYVTNLGTDPDMDSTGEFLPYVLRDSSDQRILNVLPQSDGKVIRQTLGEALDSWMAYLRTGVAIARRESGKGPVNEVVLSTTEQVLVQINLKSIRRTVV